MTVWRLESTARNVATALSGEGAAARPGRWNQAGVPVVYASATLSLALLERLVHAGEEFMTAPLSSYRVAIPSTVRVEPAGTAVLPRDWRAVPAPASAREFGTRWAKEARTAVLRVPSAVIPAEFNYVFNPLHADFKRITVAGPQTFAFDPRLKGA